MKRIICTIILALCAVFAMGQTPAEILGKMETALEQRKSEGVAMAVDAKVPIVGTLRSKTWTLGEKYRMEATMMGVTLITWIDETTQWELNTKKNELTIKTLNPNLNKKSEGDGDLSDLSGLSKGYDLTITAETDTQWQIQGKRSKDNDDKDSPKSVEIVVAKGTFLPISFTAKASGVRMTLHDITFGVPLSKVTFNPADYPDAKIIDKR